MQNGLEYQSNVKKDQNLTIRYSYITYKMRKDLIEMVQENGLSVYKSAKILTIKQSTAKAIMRKYKRNGHIFIKKDQKLKIEILNQQQEQSQKEQNQRQMKVQKEEMIVLTEINPVKREQPLENVKVLYNTYHYFWCMVHLWMLPNYSM